MDGAWMSTPTPRRRTPFPPQPTPAALSGSPARSYPIHSQWSFLEFQDTNWLKLALLLFITWPCMALSGTFPVWSGSWRGWSRRRPPLRSALFRGYPTPPRSASRVRAGARAMGGTGRTLFPQGQVAGGRAAGGRRAPTGAPDDRWLDAERTGGTHRWARGPNRHAHDQAAGGRPACDAGSAR